MRTFQYNELGKELSDGSIENVIITITDQEIVDKYFPYWSGRMKEARLEHLISIENCINDFLVVNWAWEITNNAP